MFSSGEIGGAGDQRSGEWVNEGDLVIVPVDPPDPFGVGRVTATDEDGSLEIR